MNATALPTRPLALARVTAWCRVHQSTAQAAVAPMALAVAILQWKMPPLSYLPLMVLTSLFCALWHLVLLPHVLQPHRFAQLLRADHPPWWIIWQATSAEARRRVALQDLCSLKWYVLAWWPFGGAFLALAAVVHHRVGARRRQGLTHTEALAQVLVFGLPTLAGIAVAQWLIQGALFGFPLYCENHPAVCGLK